MTLPLAPTSISVNQINVELGLSGTAPAPINDAPFRTLAGLPTPASQLSWSDFYGKTASFTTVATCQPTAGGWYMGCTTACGVNYYLIAAPAAPVASGYIGGCFRCWGPNPACLPTGALNCCICVQLRVFAPLNPLGSPLGCNPTASFDGYCITKFIQTCPNYNPCAPLPAGCTYGFPMHNAINALTLGGFSDWYFPAITELQTLYCNTDRSWTCGVPGPTLCNMKSTGNQFPANIPLAINAPVPGSPGCWPYLGYVTWGGPVPTIPAPGSAMLNGLSNCNNGWNPINQPQAQTAMCPPQCLIPGLAPLSPLCVGTGVLSSTTQAGGQPQGIYNTAPSCIWLGYLNIRFDCRFNCANCAFPTPGARPAIPGVFPTGTPFNLYAVSSCQMTRAVRRVAI
jgi:hypothetical protein